MKKALRADDRETVRIKDHLDAIWGSSVQVVEAPTAAEALTAFGNDEFDITFLDGVFSDGTPMVDVLEKMLLQRPGAHVIVTSARPAEHPEVTEALGAGAYGYLAKPVHRADVQALLKRIEHDERRIERIR